MDAAIAYRQWESQTAHWSEPSMIGKESAAVWFWLNEHQRERGVAGSFLEVGTFRGHAASVMAAMARPEDELVLLDIDIQERAIRDSVEATSKKARLCLLQGDTREISATDRLRDWYGKVRWVHVDGEHSADAITNDLSLALRALSADGVIVVDDFFNIASACITHAVFAFLERHPHELRMFLCGFNKAYLARPKYLAQYQRACGPSLISYLERCGLECTLCENAHSTELDYRSLLSRRGEIRYRGIGFMKRDFE